MLTLSALLLGTTMTVTSPSTRSEVPAFDAPTPADHVPTKRRSELRDPFAQAKVADARPVATHAELIDPFAAHRRVRGPKRSDRSGVKAPFKAPRPAPAPPAAAPPPATKRPFRGR